MGRAIELITAQVTAPGASFTAMSAVTGNSFTVRDTTRPVNLAVLISSRQSAGVGRITSPSMHDTSVGLQISTPTGTATLMVLNDYPQPMYPQDTPTVSATGSATAGDIELTSWINIYDDLPGIDGRFIDWQTLARRIRNIYTNTITISTGTTGGYSGSVAVNSAQDQFKANTEYALIGYQVSGATTHAIRYVGPDWGNLGVGGPGWTNAAVQRSDNWFVELSRSGFGRCIPVMNSTNRSLTTIDAAQNENGADPIVTTVWAELGR